MKTVFTVDAKALLTLGRDSIKDHTTALLELVKNSYDADATVVDIDIYCNADENFIRLADNGYGMSESELKKYWLRIGYSEKRTNKLSKLKRRKTGEKGIGRISADRLGSLLTLTTKAKNEKICGLMVNWDDFDVEDKELSTIPISMLDNLSDIMIPGGNNSKDASGTELIIKNLRQKWTKDDIANLYDELSILTPPFKQVKDFEIFLKTDVTPEYCKKVESPFYSNAEIELEARYDEDKEIIHYAIRDRISTKQEPQLIKGTIKWLNLVQRSQVYDKEVVTKPDFGTVGLVLLFYPRESKILEGTKFRLSDLRDFLDKNAGVKIYRDDIRVKPYGSPDDPEGDWLGLAERKTREPAAVSRPTYRVAANQLVGAVFVGRDTNPNLVDSSSREGLIEDDAYKQLRALVLNCLTLLEAHRHERYKAEKKIKTAEKEKILIQSIDQLKQEIDAVQRELQVISRQVPRTYRRSIQRTLDKTVAAGENLTAAERTVNEFISQSRIYRGLATIGIASAVFGHETQSAVSEFISATYTASSILRKNPERIDIVLKELEKAIKYASQVSAWGAFALARVQRDKRIKQKINIKNIIETTIKEVQPVFNAVDITVNLNLDAVEAHTFAMDIESILLNLLTNAYTACLQVPHERKVNIILREEMKNKANGFSLTVSDSGSGIDPKLMEKIWAPLFTTKVDRDGKQVGTGLGLTIIQSIIEDLNGSKEVGDDPELHGARFVVWLPLI